MPGGRPTDFSEEYIEQGRKLCLLGYTDKELAEFWEVQESTINNWKKKHPKFLESINKGKVLADADIADSLYNRAKGYSHPEAKFMTVSHGHGGGSSIEQIDTIKHYPPDTAAALIWLKNRRSISFKDKQEIDQNINLGGDIQINIIEGRK